MSPSVHNKQVICKRTRKYGIYILYSLYQHSAGVQKPGHALTLRN